MTCPEIVFDYNSRKMTTQFTDTIAAGQSFSFSKRYSQAELRRAIWHRISGTRRQRKAKANRLAMAGNVVVGKFLTEQMGVRPQPSSQP